MRAASHFPNICVAEVATSLCVDEFSLANCLRIVLVPILQSNYSWYCNISHLTVGSGFCLATVHLFFDLVQIGSRQSWPRVCTRYCLLLVRSQHGVSKASMLQRKRLCRGTSLRRHCRSRSETCIHVLLRQTGTLTQNITTIESKFRGLRL